MAAFIYDKMPWHSRCILDVWLETVLRTPVFCMSWCCWQGGQYCQLMLYNYFRHILFAVCAVLFDAWCTSTPSLESTHLHLPLSDTWLCDNIDVHNVAMQGQTHHQLLVQVQCIYIQQLCTTRFSWMVIALYVNDGVLVHSYGIIRMIWYRSLIQLA